MKPISPHYRTDEVGVLNSELQQYLDDNFLKKLPNLTKNNPKILVVFSGGNAVGKSTLSKKIQMKLDALVLENDSVKRNLLNIRPDLKEDKNQLNRLTWQYTMGLYSTLDKFTNNGLVVRDGVIDWYFDRVLPIFEKAGYRLFIIGYDLSDKKTKELIQKRGDTFNVAEERFYAIMKDHTIHMKRFRKLYEPTVTLNDNDVFNHKYVLTKLEKFVNTVRDSQ